MAYQIAGDRLTSLFRPRSVALVGASDKSVFSQIAYHNLVEFGFAEHTYLVSRRGTPTHGQPTVTSCAQIGEPVDVAYLMVPQAGLLEALDDAAAAGIRNACVLSSGYAEAGEAGRAAQAELADHAAGLGMVLLGPNHLGFANLTDGVPVCSIPGLPAESGPVALLSQSGASSSAMVDFARMVNVGLSYLVTLGNEAMITAGHVLDYLVDDPGTRAVAIFMETVRDPETFRRAARRAAQAGKAIVVLKAGSSVLSARTAAAHTGALVGDDRVINAVFADLGVIRVDSIEDMLITAGAAAALGRLDRPGIGIVSISGGACDIVADRADDLGADLPELAPSTRDALAAIMPAYGTVQNPLDVTGAAVIDPTIFTRSIEAMSADPSIGVIGVVNSIGWIDTGRPYPGQMFVDAIGAGMRAASCPAAYINQVMQPVTGFTRASMAQGGVPYVIPGLRQAVVALRNVARWSEVTRSPQTAPSPAAVPVPAPARRRGKWSEQDARTLLGDAGVPVVPARLAGSAAEAVKAAAGFGGPLSVKIVSPDILHKSDAGGVLLDVPPDEEAVRAAYQAVTAAAPDGARIDGVLVSPMRPWRHRTPGRRGPRPAVGPGPGRGDRRAARRGAAGFGAGAAAGHAWAGGPPAGPAARPRGTGRRPRRRARRPGRPDRGDRQDRRPRPGPGRRPGIARSQPATGRRHPDRGTRRRGHLEGAQLMRTAFTDLVGVPHPIVGFNRSPGVVAAVTNAGGFGVLGASAYTPAELDAQLTWIDEQTEGKPYGVDLLVPEKFAAGDPANLVASLRAQIPDGHLAFVSDLLDRYGIPDVPGNPEHDEIAAGLTADGAAPLLDVAFRHPIRLIANALGPPPAGLVDRARKQGVPVAALVGQPRHAIRQLEAGVDLLIAQGTEAGGHTGTIATMVLTPEIVDIAAGRPVLAAGGIASGRQMAAALALGAAGVWCGSVWLSSEEDVANQAIKAKFLSGDQLGHGALADQDRQAGPPAAQRLARGVGAARQPGAAVPAAAADAGQRGVAADRRGRQDGSRRRAPARVVLRRPGRRLIRADQAGRRDHPPDRRRLRAADPGTRGHVMSHPSLDPAPRKTIPPSTPAPR